jgi:hypothetical protein
MKEEKDGYSQRKISKFQDGNKWTLNISQDTVEANYFGSYWSAALPVGQKWSGSLEGWFDATTGGNQITLLKSVFSATKVQDAKFFVGGSTTGLFYMPQYTTEGVMNSSQTDAGAYFSNYKHTAGAKELGTWTCDVVGYKGIGLFSSTIAGGLVVESTA